MSRRNRLRKHHHFETKNQPLLPRPDFVLRVTRCFLVTLIMIIGSLFGGMLGYHFLEDMPWIDAFANASMILSGMGPLVPMQTWAGKLFAGLYALYSGLILILASGVILAPFVHRFLHRFHITDEEEKSNN